MSVNYMSRTERTKATPTTEKTDKKNILTLAKEFTEIVKDLTPQQQSEALMLIKGVALGTGLAKNRKSA